MPGAIPGKPQPMQMHAEVLQVAGGRGCLRVPAQQAHGGKAEAFTRSGQRMQMIGVCPAEADQPLRASGLSGP